MLQIGSYSEFEFAIILIAGLGVLIGLFLYLEYLANQRDLKIQELSKLLDNKTESERERIMSKFIIGLAIANSSQRRIYKIIAEGNEKKE